jgi:hypothetical protein
MATPQQSGSYTVSFALEGQRDQCKSPRNKFKPKRKPHNFKQYLNAYGKLLRVGSKEDR